MASAIVLRGGDSGQRPHRSLLLTCGGIDMHRHHHIRRNRLALAAPLAALALLITPALAGAGVAEAKAASCSNRVTTPPPNPGTQDNFFRGVAALSPCDVWAVGDYRNEGSLRFTMAEHWNGTSWKLVHTPSPGSS